VLLKGGASRSTATLSNCGDALKLCLPSAAGNSRVAALIALGMVTTAKIRRKTEWVIRSQVLPRKQRTQFTDYMAVGFSA
jgi:hypothetical protein